MLRESPQLPVDPTERHASCIRDLRTETVLAPKLIRERQALGSHFTGTIINFDDRSRGGCSRTADIPNA